MDRKTRHTIVIIAMLVGTAFSISAISTTTTYKNKMKIEAAAATMQNLTKVEAGRGNASAIIDQFFPQTAEIKVGQNITWYNPTQVGEPHTVTFALDNKTMTGPVAPICY
jgi:plastocyanin